MGITLSNEEIKETIENLPMLKATRINIGNQAFKLLGDLQIRQALLSEFPFIETFLYEAIWIPDGVARPSKGIVNNPGISAYKDSEPVNRSRTSPIIRST